MNVLLTAFGPFKDFKRNPSEMVLEEVQQRGRADGLVTEWAVLPVAFGAIDRFIAGIPQRKYDVIIHTGVDSRSKKSRIELCARNRVKGRDVHGVEFEGAIEEKGPAVLTSTLASHLRDGFCSEARDIEPSEDAGAYLCNYVYYKSLRRFGRQSGVAFLHLADFINHPNASSLETQAGMLAKILEYTQRAAEAPLNHLSIHPPDRKIQHSGKGLPSAPLPHQPGGYRHHGVKHGPYRAEYPARRIPLGLRQLRVPAAGLDEDGSCRCAEGQRQPPE